MNSVFCYMPENQRFGMWRSGSLPESTWRGNCLHIHELRCNHYVKIAKLACYGLLRLSARSTAKDLFSKAASFRST